MVRCRPGAPVVDVGHVDWPVDDDVWTVAVRGAGGLRVSPLGPLGSLNSHHRRTLELVLQKSPASFGLSIQKQLFAEL